MRRSRQAGQLWSLKPWAKRCNLQIVLFGWAFQGLLGPSRLQWPPFRGLGAPRTSGTFSGPQKRPPLPSRESRLLGFALRPQSQDRASGPYNDLSFMRTLRAFQSLSQILQDLPRLKALQRVCRPFAFTRKGASQVCAGPILPRSRPPGLAFRSGLLSSKHNLPGPDKIVVQDWKHPVRTPSKETKGLEPPPNPNWHPSGLDKSSLQTQIQLFKIGSIQSRHRLKKTKGLEPPASPNWHPSGLDKPSLQTQLQLFKIGSNQSRHRLKKTKASSHPESQTGTRLVWTNPACGPKSNCSRLEASSQGTV